MSTSDPFLPLQGEDAAHSSEAPVQSQDHHVEGERDGDVDVFLPAESEGESSDDADEPPVSDDTFFRTPTGERADPAND